MNSKTCCGEYFIEKCLSTRCSHRIWSPKRSSAAQIADFKSGKEKALMSIVGMVMKASQGKANPTQVNEIVRKKITAL